jgi:uncharacterized RDD family membrane protein YckC
MNGNKFLSNQSSPWTRFFARLLDYSLFYCLLILPFFFASLIDNDLIHFAAIYLIPLLWIPLEALFISLLGTTPGKFLFGIFIKDAGNKKIPFTKALKRSFKVWYKGVFGNLPLINLYYVVKRFLEIRKNGLLSFDKEAGIIFYQKRKRSIRTTLASCMLGFLGTFFVAEYEIREAIINSGSKQTFISSQITLAEEKDLKEAGVTPTKKWNCYKDPEGNFEIHFPGNPDESFKNIPIPKTKDSLPYYTVNFKLDDHDIEYNLNYTTLPKNWLKWKPALLMKGALKIICSKLSEGKILSKSFFTLKDLPTLEFVLQKPDNKLSSGRLILIDNVLYKIEVIYPKEKKDLIDMNVKTFLQSFKPSM